MYCNKFKKARKQEEKATAKNQNKQAAKYAKQEKLLASHRCLKNFQKLSKAMESESIVKCIRTCPITEKCYVRTIIMDDDTTTPAHLREDKGPNSKERLPKSLMGILVLVNSSRCRQTWRNHFYKLAKKKKKVTNMSKDRAKKWGLTLGIGFTKTKDLPWTSWGEKLTFLSAIGAATTVTVAHGAFLDKPWRKVKLIIRHLYST